jgi:hypothetical protein|mmetsp:Transcript_96316/g.162004  ORF Transcript_96316/g.162004 Transcript_96316/m.162004 type:complete len:120 (-) Transcript_96316:757-1116(-)
MQSLASVKIGLSQSPAWLVWVFAWSLSGLTKRHPNLFDKQLNLLLVQVWTLHVTQGKDRPNTPAHAKTRRVAWRILKYRIQAKRKAVETNSPGGHPHCPMLLPGKPRQGGDFLNAIVPI